MEAAWETIKKDAAVTCSIDLFFIGIVFFRKEFKEKQAFCYSILILGSKLNFINDGWLRIIYKKTDLIRKD